MRLIRRAAVFVFVAAACMQGSVRADPPVAPALATISADASATPEIERLLQAALADYPGVAFVVSGPNGATWRGAAGLADIETNTAMTAETPLSVYSVAKPMTATLAMALVDAGKLNLDGAISGVVSVPAPLAALTPRDLLTHTSGIRDYRDGEWMRFARSPCAAPHDALAAFVNDAPGPRGVFDYSTFNYVLLSDVVQQASGVAFQTLMRDRVFTPAGMTTASFWAPGPRRPPNGHERSGRQFRAARAIDNSCKFGAGAIIASADDLAKFGAALAAGRLIPDASWRAMTANAQNHYGLGLGVGTLAGGSPIAAHSGSAIGGTSAIVIDLETGVSVAVVGNAEGSSLVDEAKALLTLARAAPAFAAAH